MNHIVDLGPVTGRCTYASSSITILSVVYACDCDLDYM